MGFFWGVVKKSLGVFAKIGGGWVNIYMEVVGTEVGASGGCGFWWGGVLRDIGYRFLFIGFLGEWGGMCGNIVYLRMAVAGLPH